MLRTSSILLAEKVGSSLFLPANPLHEKTPIGDFSNIAILCLRYFNPINGKWHTGAGSGALDEYNENLGKCSSSAALSCNEGGRNLSNPNNAISNFPDTSSGYIGNRKRGGEKGGNAAKSNSTTNKTLKSRTLIFLLKVVKTALKDGVSKYIKNKCECESV